MKTQLFRSILFRKVIFLSLMLGISAQCNNSTSARETDPRPNQKKSIKLAILLDTSNSMDGLIDQAKSQLWTIVNQLAKATCDHQKPELRIALYEYGNDNLPQSEGFIRLVCPLTSDLDRISESLFSLRTNGGQEYCGQVIHTALKEQAWDVGNGDYQVIFIAGNEPFTQGSYSFREVCAQARKKGVIVNTIFCGNFDEGIQTSWKDGAILTGGDYSSIEQNRKTVYISTPYDEKIVELNKRLNDTYVYYGESGYEKKEFQAKQDANAASMGSGNLVGRTVSKSSHVYKNSSWDLVDASQEENFSISSIRQEELPEEMRGMSEQKRKEYIDTKAKERQMIQMEIGKLNKQREEYIANQRQENNQEDMLDQAVLNSIVKQGKLMGFDF